MHIEYTIIHQSQVITRICVTNTGNHKTSVSFRKAITEVAEVTDKVDFYCVDFVNLEKKIELKKIFESSNYFD